MVVRNPVAKRQQLLDAALAEFAAHGIGGARIGAIAERAGVSAGLVYSFYDGKERLFEAVFDSIVEQTVSGIPIDADDLPEYAGKLFDGGEAYPDVMRFMTWYQLEGGDTAARASAVESMRSKVEAIEAAQRRGTVTTRFTAGQILALVLTVANIWQQGGENVLALVPPEKRRETVVEAVRVLVAP